MSREFSFARFIVRLRLRFKFDFGLRGLADKLRKFNDSSRFDQEIGRNWSFEFTSLVKLYKAQGEIRNFNTGVYKQNWFPEP